MLIAKLIDLIATLMLYCRPCTEKGTRKGMKLFGALALALTLFFITPSTAYAESPIVCLAGAGEFRLQQFHLADCGMDPSKPIYVELLVIPTVSFSNLITMNLGENNLSCTLLASASATCAVTVWDGVLDQASAGNTQTVQHYRLTVSEVNHQSIFTQTLPSGDFLVVRREYDYGDILLAGLVLFLVILVVFITFVAFYFQRRGY